MLSALEFLAAKHYWFIVPHLYVYVLWLLCWISKLVYLFSVVSVFSSGSSWDWEIIRENLRTNVQFCVNPHHKPFPPSASEPVCHFTSTVGETVSQKHVFSYVLCHHFKMPLGGKLAQQVQNHLETLSEIIMSHPRSHCFEFECQVYMIQKMFQTILSINYTCEILM